jgi:hypothetical protein
MSIMDFFKPSTSSATASTTATPATNEPAKPAVAQPDPNNPAKVSENPFDAYQKVFDNAAKNSDIQAPTFSLDAKVISDVANKMDFTKGINPELMSKATGGDAAAMMQLIQEVGRNSYRASLEHATKLTDTHLGQRSEFESKNLKRGVKEQLTSDALSAGNANLNHPVIKAELNRIAKQFAASPEYADASPAEIANAAKNYMTDLHAAMNPADPTKTKEGKAKPTEIDYMEYITGVKSS